MPRMIHNLLCAAWDAHCREYYRGPDCLPTSAARAVLGHTCGGCVTDVYTFDAVADEMVRKAAPAVEALG